MSNTGDRITREDCRVLVEDNTAVLQVGDLKIELAFFLESEVFEDAVIEGQDLEVTTESVADGELWLITTPTQDMLNINLEPRMVE